MAGAGKLHSETKVKTFLFPRALLVDSGTQSKAEELQHEALYLQVPGATQDGRGDTLRNSLQPTDRSMFRRVGIL
ncbi:MAG: hypothetical protein DMG11_06035 [Acidobacteria bacterium]|nr:MAG: hypothetical protein DMG11_06035 [Acidobacteriota bacterium]